VYESGIPEAGVEKMIKHNPAELLDLPPAPPREPLTEVLSGGRTRPLAPQFEPASDGNSVPQGVEG
jgi:hypothetical protein